MLNPSQQGFDRFGKIMKRRLVILSRVLVIALVILALFLVYWLYLEYRYNGAGDFGPTVTTGIGLLIAVVLFVSISFWIAFADREVKSWERNLLLVGMISGLLLFLFLGFIFALDLSMSMPGWRDANPTAVNNLSITTDLMLIIAAILFAGILGFILTRSRVRSIVDWMKTL